MHIQYYGFSCVKITTKPTGRGGDDVTIVLNPFTRASGVTPPQFSGADIIIASALTPTYYADTAAKADALQITMPGEYAAHGVQIVGMALPPEEDAAATMYVIETEGLKVACLAGTRSMPLAQHFDEMADAQVLLVDAGGAPGYDGAQAAEIARKVGSAFVIPLHMRLPGVAATASLADTTAFCKAIGTCPQETVHKTVIKAKDAEAEATRVILMAPGA